MERSLPDLAAEWRDEAVTLRRRGAAVQAVLLESCANDLEGVLQEREDELLSIKQAAAESGSSEETLRRQVREGKLPAERRPGKRTHLRIRRGDLVHKAGNRAGKGPKVDSPTSTAYDPRTDARDIAQRQETTHG
jgi:hypothetical protein